MVQLSPLWSPFKPHPVQQAVWQCDKRFIALPCGRGSGKTEMARRKLVLSLPEIKPWDTPRYFYGAPTRDQARRISWDKLKAMVPKSWYACAPSETQLVIRTIFGSELHVVGLDKPQRIEGDQWDGGVLDESCDLHPKTFELNVLPAMQWRNGWVWRIGVPKRAGPSVEEYRTFFEEAQAGKMKDAAGFTWPSADILTPDQLDYAQTHMDPVDYAEQFDAVFQRIGGGIYHQFDEKRNVRECSYNPELPILVGSDFNVDPMAWVLAHNYEGERLEVFDEIWLRDTNTPAALDVLYDKWGHHRRGFEFYGDATGKQRKTSAVQSDYNHIANDERFKRLGRSVYYPDSNPALVDRYAATNALLCNAKGLRRLFVDERCVHLIQGLRSDYYKPGTRQPAEGGDLLHAGDAVGYIVHYIWPIRVELDYDTPVVYIERG